VATSFNPNPIVKKEFNFEALGIGGLAEEFGIIFRRAFASRLYPASFIKKTGIQPVRGLLLYGPPGTGKTLIARQIAKMLNAREPKIVSGPEVLNKYVGLSEENIRGLFKDAEAEYKSKGDNSGLHIIIFDELDAVCRQRGSRADSTGVGDSVVNQLLSKLDGVEQLNNIIVIGMTNRKELIDEALLRPGRLEVHVEIKLPDAEGRLEILMIHTAEMRKNNLLEADVDLNEAAELTKNFSGAELVGLIRSALSLAFNRNVDVKNFTIANDNAEGNIRIGRADFLAAMKEITPVMGISDEVITSIGSSEGFIIPFSNRVDEILSMGEVSVKALFQLKNCLLNSLLLYGPPGSGKSTLAAKIAINSNFPLIKIISAKELAGMSDYQKINHIITIFEKAYRSEMSCIIIDGLEKLIQFNAFGPRFSNEVLHTLVTFMQTNPPPGHKLLVITTTCIRDILHQMIDIAFSFEIFVPPLSTQDELAQVFGYTEVFSDAEQKQIMDQLPENFSIAIRTLLQLINNAQQDEHKVEFFLNSFFALK
jgi:vesicle-fusing ATPase